MKNRPVTKLLTEPRRIVMFKVGISTRAAVPGGQTELHVVDGSMCSFCAHEFDIVAGWMDGRHPWRAMDWENGDAASGQELRWEYTRLEIQNPMKPAGILVCRASASTAAERALRRPATPDRPRHVGRNRDLPERN